MAQLKARYSTFLGGNPSDCTWARSRGRAYFRGSERANSWWMVVGQRQYKNIWERAKWNLNESLTEEVVRGKQLARHSICEGTMAQETGISLFSLKPLVSKVHHMAISMVWGKVILVNIFLFEFSSVDYSFMRRIFSVGWHWQKESQTKWQ